MQKKVVHPLLGEILYVKSAKNKTLRLTVTPAGCLRVSFPVLVSFSTAKRFVEENLEKILAFTGRVRVQQALMRQQTTPYTARELQQIRAKAREILPESLEKNAKRLNQTVKVRNMAGITMHNPFSYNRLFIKNNRSNWGSCSSKRNINLNMHLVELPEELRDFVIIHELCHLVYPNHGEKFHALVNLSCGGKEKEYSRTLRKYSHLLKRNT